MAVQPIVLQKEREEKAEDPMDKLMRGLQLAQGLFGIVSNVGNLEAAKQAKETNALEQQRLRRQLNLEATGYKPTDTKDLTPSTPETAGAKKVRSFAGYDQNDQPKFEDKFYSPKNTADYTQKDLDELVSKGGIRYAQEGEKGALKRSVLLPDQVTTNTAYIMDTGPEKAAAAKAEKAAERAKDLQIARLNNDAKAAQKSVKDSNYESLPKEGKIQVDELAKGVGHRKNIMNILQGGLKQYQNATTESQKITIGNGMVKSLNAVLGSDAVGAEEVGRLAANLKFQVANFTGPGSFVGRDLKGFEKQVQDSIDAYDSANKLSLSQIDEIKGIAPSNAQDNAGTLKNGPLAPGVTTEQKDLVAWAYQNPNDPRSAQVLSRFGIKPQSQNAGYSNAPKFGVMGVK